MPTFNSDEELTSFAAAYVDAKEIGKKANEEMTKAVEARGLSPDRYNQLVEAVRQDPQLQERVAEALSRQQQ